MPLRSSVRAYGDDARQAGVWLGSRLINGVLGLFHVSLVAAAIGPGEAGRFFLLWTATWLLATVLRFGLEGLLPRVVAEAQQAGAVVPSLLRVAPVGVLCAAAALVPLLVMFRVPLSGETVAVTAIIATCWAGTFVVAATLKAYNKVGLSGVVMNTVWPLGPTLAPLFLLGGGGDWHDLAEITAIATVASFALACAVALRALGRGVLGRLVSTRAPMLPIEVDLVGAAVLSLLYELLLWLPVAVAALAGFNGVTSAAIYAAVRVTGLVSWPYTAVVAVLTPRIAASLAAHELPRARWLITRGSLFGLVATVPSAILIALLARPILEVFDPAYGAFAATLALLVAGRIFDAASGPVGEALLVGRRTWLDCVLISVGVGAALAIGLGIEPSVGPKAAGIAGSIALGITNVLRLAVVWRLFARGWRTIEVLPDWMRRQATPTLVLVGGIVLAIVVESAGLATRGDVWWAVAASVVVAVGAVTLGAARHGLHATATSPVAILALVLLAHFALRPATLIDDPISMTWIVRTLGYDWTSVSQSTVLGAAGLGVLALGFLFAWRPTPEARRQVRRVDPRRLIKVVTATLLVGTVLWALLFRHLGGVSALVTDPSNVHLSQFGAGYGSVGLALCLGAALVSLQVWLARPSRVVLATTIVAAGVGLAGCIALATRGVLVATAVAALVLVLRAKHPRPRTVVVSVLCLLVVAAGAVLLRAYRDYSQYMPSGQAVSQVTHTRPLRLLAPDLIEFDHLVALHEYVPGRLGWLNGSSVKDVPAAFLPRALVGSKPQSVDFRLAQLIVGPQPTAGTPFTLPGEMWWNFRFGGALVALLAFGVLAGLGWRFVLQRGAAGELVAALMTGYAYLILTRPLGAMLLTAAMSLFGALVPHLGATMQADDVRKRARALTTDAADRGARLRTSAGETAARVRLIASRL